MLRAPHGRKIVIGMGDDAAAWRPSRSHLSVISTDALVENVHFRLGEATLEEIGYRACAANVSDIAAMGARPVLATVAIGLPQRIEPDDVLEIYRGIDRLARSVKIEIAGGDIVRSAELFISLTVVGEVSPTSLKRRSGARVNDVAAVTGPLGASRAALESKAHHLPPPRVAEGMWLARSRSVHAMMDISDGLSTDLARMAVASNCGAIVDQIPVAETARKFAISRGEDAQRFAAAGGEDFELLAAIAPRAFNYLSGRFRKRFGRPLLRVGVFREEAGIERVGGGEPLPAGWDHLRCPGS
ncbi:MAG: thiamine-phosphate kinase [Candidatus Eremiobacteraeota bacterium]|nr:thiamine-phosphate kinase [Candidatus Eremiobacteraeota bacterium]